MPWTGIEPARPLGHTPLKRARLPIPPPGHNLNKQISDQRSAISDQRSAISYLQDSKYRSFQVEIESKQLKNFEPKSQN